MSDQRDQMQEVLDRMRRMETRLTKFLMTMGFDTETHRPLWRDGTIHLPSPSASLKSCLEVIPDSWPTGSAVHVSHAGKTLVTLIHYQP